MKIAAVGAVLALAAAACGAGDDVATTAPVTTSPVTTSPVTTSPPGSDADALAGTSWVVVAMNDADGAVAIVSGSEPSIDFGTDGASISGSTGCNAFSGGVTIGGGTLAIGPTAVTERGCIPQEIMEVEAAFLRILQGISSFAIADERLELTGAAGSITLEQPEPIVDAQLEGTRWNLDTLSDGIAATSVLTTTSPDLVVENGAIRGTTGCNDFGGEVDTTGARFIVTSMFWTEIGCEPDVMTQEAFILDVLQNAERFEIVGDRLTVFSSGGESVGFRAS